MRARIRGHKYGAVRTEVDGYKFASKAEAKRYQELKLLEKAGEIRNLELQPAFELSVFMGALTGGVPIGRYVADFSYEERFVRGISLQTLQPHIEWVDRVEDVKGFKTELYRWKKKHVEAQYGIQITEIGRATKATKAKRAKTTHRSAAPK